MNAVGLIFKYRRKIQHSKGSTFDEELYILCTDFHIMLLNPCPRGHIFNLEIKRPLFYTLIFANSDRC